MYSFLVLGIVPGTNIQISFQAWLVLLPLVAVAAWIGRRQISKRLAAVNLTPLRLPLHASQLHQRAR